MASGTNGSLISDSPSSTSSSSGLSSDHQPHLASSVLPVDPKDSYQPSCMCWNNAGLTSTFFSDCTDCNVAHQRVHSSADDRSQNELNVPVVEPWSSWLMEEQLRAINFISNEIDELDRERISYELKLAKSEKAEEQDKMRRLIEEVQSDLEYSRDRLKRRFKSVAVRKLQYRNDKDKIELLADELADLRCAQMERDRLIREDCAKIRQLESKLAETENDLTNTRALVASNSLGDESLTVTCSVCRVARISTAFQCGHLSCGDCSDRLNQCHVCRRRILQRTLIFL